MRCQEQHYTSLNRVPAVYLDPGNLPILTFLACSRINKLRAISGAYGFESDPESSQSGFAFAGPLGVTARPDFAIERLQTRIDGLAFKGEDTEDAFMDATQRFLADKSLKRLNSESELAECQ
jgi:hypothetical protein